MARLVRSLDGFRDKFREVIAERVNAERLVLLGWSRAIVMQMAHPLIAAGVADHSHFRASPMSAATRLHGTVRAMLALTFGDPIAHGHAIAGIRAIHARVRGDLRETTGVFEAGTAYSADDPALLLWVHATLVDTALRVYTRFFRPLTDADRDEYCRETAPLVQALGAPDPGPETWADAQRYLTEMYGSGRIAVSAQAREIAGAVLAPPLSWTIAPATRVNRLITLGWLPAWIRDAYGVEWTARDERALARWVRVIAGARRIAPPWLAQWRSAR